MTRTSIPEPVILFVGELIGAHYFNHRAIERLFVIAGAPGGAPPGNCVVKAQQWLRMSNDVSTVDPLQILGKVIEGYMESEIDSYDARRSKWLADRETLKTVFARHNISYVTGGRIMGSVLGAPARSLVDLLRGRDLGAIEREFERALSQVERDPPAAITSACAILEAFCKVFIEDEGLPMPKDQSVKPLWHVARDRLGLRTDSVEETDLRSILGGLGSIAEGIGALRTHAGSAHGRGRNTYRIEARHARLAIHSAHSFVVFCLETWAVRRGSSKAA